MSRLAPLRQGRDRRRRRVRPDRGRARQVDDAAPRRGGPQRAARCRPERSATWTACSRRTSRRPRSASTSGSSRRYVDGTNVGGCSFLIHVAHAAAAIAEGRCEVALITHGESGRSRVGMPPRPSSAQTHARPVRGAVRAARPAGSYALACSRHMAEYGTTKEQLAEIAVATRKWAALNPKAMFRDPITVEDVLNSRMICWPFNLLDCCLVTDAGGAVVLTSAERARDLRRTPVAVLGFGEALDHHLISPDARPDRTARRASPGRAPSRWPASATPTSTWPTIYDSFTYTVLLTPGGPRLLREGRGRRLRQRPADRARRRVPAQHQRWRALVHPSRACTASSSIIEAVRQLRHDYADQGERQVDGRQDRAGPRDRRRALRDRHADPGEGLMADYTKPLPTPDPVTQPFWDSLKAHAIQLQRCGGCSRFIFYPRAHLPRPACSDDLTWTPVSGRGVVHAFAIPHRHPNRGLPADGPYVVALVELEEGARMMTNLVDVDPTPEAVKVGMPVEIVYDDVTEEITLPTVPAPLMLLASSRQLVILAKRRISQTT